MSITPPKPFSAQAWNAIYKHFNPPPKEPPNPPGWKGALSPWPGDDGYLEWRAWFRPYEDAEIAWEKTRLQRKRDGWLPDPKKLAKCSRRDFLGFGKQSEREVNEYLASYGLALDYDVAALRQKLENITAMRDRLDKSIAELRARIGRLDGE